MNHRRRLLKALAVTGLLGSAGISGGIRTVLARGNQPAIQGIRRLRGDVRINAKPAQEGQRVEPDDTITTGPGSEVIYVIGQDAFLQRENSTIHFAAEAAKKLMRVLNGKILSVFGKGAYTIQTPTATIGIRGTGCYIEAEGLGEQARTYFCLCYGSVDLSPNAAPNVRESYQTTHHERPLMIYNDTKMPKIMMPANAINHTDIELDLLEGLVGRLRPGAANKEYGY